MYRENAHLISAIQFVEEGRELGNRFGFTDEELKQAFEEVFRVRADVARFVDVQNVLANWLKFYQEVFNEAPDFSNCVIPVDQNGYCTIPPDGRGSETTHYWIIPFAKGMAASRIWQKCKECFECWSYYGDDLDGVVSIHERTAENGNYVICIHDCVEANWEFRNISARQIKKMKFATMTLPERLLLELWYFWKTGKNLDFQISTLCAGSRDINVKVPRVGGFCGVSIHQTPPGESRLNMRVRSVV